MAEASESLLSKLVTRSREIHAIDQKERREREDLMKRKQSLIQQMNAEVQITCL